jgi:hypothetical protein
MKSPPHNPSFKTITSSQIKSVQALMNGVATAGQQKEALWVICVLISDKNSASFGDSDRQTNFNEGRRHVGIAIDTIVEGRATNIFNVIDNVEGQKHAR